MAGTASARRGDESAQSAVAGRPSRPARSLSQRLGLGGPRRYLQIALALHLVALAVTLATPGALHSAGLIGVGLVLLIAALALPDQSALAAKPADPIPAPGRQELAPALDTALLAPAGLPPSLPFIGLSLENGANLDKLSDAAQKLRHVKLARTHPWGELMARVSHELRTPLNAVIGFSDVMNSELLGPVGHPRYREYARHIRDCGRELLKSAEDTLAITCLLDVNQAHTSRTAHDLEALVADAWQFYQEEALARDLKLEQSVPEGLALVMERRPLRQILINLFAEAVRRAPDGGTIGFTACQGGEVVQIEAFVRGKPNSSSIGEASLAICLARALLEMQGASLLEVDDPFSTWRALTTLKCATQQDFFGLPYAPYDDRPKLLS